MSILNQLSGDKKRSDFAIPENRAYPISDERTARMSLKRVEKFGTPEEKKRVRAACQKKWGIG
ncbi:MAG: hypothetical protein SVV67_08775 [Bacillota bacterium]|nr:hypothetical protein [Bacillota bacterium]